MIRALIATLGAGLLLSMPASAQDLGRLFLTPEQRETLDARRRARVPDKPPAEVVIQSPVTRFEGEVARSSGRSTLWVGGQVLRDGAQPDGLGVAPRAAEPGRISVSVGEGGPAVDLKVGQTLDRDTAEVKDPVGDAKSITVRRPAASSARPH
ncbi:MAG: hypothetical protein O2975_00150 [Proteobacteria bacterium]|nr:hypothetical protein [Pseudomonadota bacterium]